MLKDLSKDEVLNMINLETAEVKEIADYFSHVVNNFCFDPQIIAMEQDKSKQMRDLDILWIKVLSSYTYRTDLRNEASARVGRQLAEIPFVKREMELVGNQKNGNGSQDSAAVILKACALSFPTNLQSKGIPDTH